MTSAAEAKLDARIRPDITTLRSRTSYPRRHRPALAVLPGGADVPRPAVGPTLPARGVTRPRSVAVAPARADRDNTQSLSLAVAPSGANGGAAQSRSLAVAPARRGRSAPPLPMRLTRRGRVVVGTLAAVATVGLAALIWLAVAGRAEAAGHVRPGTPAAHSMLRVVVRPGDTLWSIAAKADPSADPRIVIQQIVDDNALRGTAITAGQVLWVPRS